MWMRRQLQRSIAASIGKPWRRGQRKAWSSDFPTAVPETRAAGGLLALFELQKRIFMVDNFIYGVEDARSVVPLSSCIGRAGNSSGRRRVTATLLTRPPASSLGFSRRRSAAITFPLCTTACVSHVHMEPMRRDAFSDAFQRLNEHALFDSAAEQRSSSPFISRTTRRKPRIRHRGDPRTAWLAGEAEIHHGPDPRHPSRSMAS